jgi:hypothetical protein
LRKPPPWEIQERWKILVGCIKREPASEEISTKGWNGIERPQRPGTKIQGNISPKDADLISHEMAAMAIDSPHNRLFPTGVEASISAVLSDLAWEIAERLSGNTS